MKNRVVEYLQLLLAFLSTTTAELLLYSDLDAPSGVGNPPSAVELYETTPLTGRKLSGVNTTKHENPPPQSHPNTNAHADVSPDETAHVSGGGASSGGSSGGASSGASTTSSSSGSSTSGGNGDNASGGGSGDSAASAGDHRPPNGSRYQSSRSLWGFLVAAAVLSVGLASLTFRKVRDAGFVRVRRLLQTWTLSFTARF